MVGTEAVAVGMEAAAGTAVGGMVVVGVAAVGVGAGMEAGGMAAVGVTRDTGGVVIILIIGAMAILIGAGAVVTGAAVGAAGAGVTGVAGSMAAGFTAAGFTAAVTGTKNRQAGGFYTRSRRQTAWSRRKAKLRQWTELAECPELSQNVNRPERVLAASWEVGGSNLRFLC